MKTIGPITQRTVVSDTTARVNNAASPLPSVASATTIPVGTAGVVALDGQRGAQDPPLSKERGEGFLSDARLTLTAAVAGALLSRSSALPDHTNATDMKRWTAKVRTLVDALVEVL